MSEPLSFFRRSLKTGAEMAGAGCLLLAFAVPLSAQPLSVPVEAARKDDTAAWALWNGVMDEVAATYYEPVSEAALTQAALDFLSPGDDAAIARLKPASVGPAPAACRQALRDFVSKVSTLPGRRGSAFEMVESALAEVMEKRLRFSHYFFSGDVEAFRKVDKGQVGLSVERAEDGRFLCLPAEGGAAWRAEIRQKDELVSVNDRTVRGMTLMRVGTLIRGPVGSVLNVQVRQKSGRNLVAALRREVAAKGRISLIEAAGGPLLRIPSFEADTVKEVRQLLREVPPQSILTIDLVGNPGGATLEAVGVAGLFLPGERPLTVAMRHAQGKETALTTTERPVVELGGITVLMDSGSASAAELLALALREGMTVPVTLSGSRSYGKGTFQVELYPNGGGRLVLAAGQLTTAKGTSWEGRGVEPTFSSQKR